MILYRGVDCCLNQLIDFVDDDFIELLDFRICVILKLATRYGNYWCLLFWCLDDYWVVLAVENGWVVEFG